MGGCSLLEVEVAYDRRWGRLENEIVIEVSGTLTQLCRNKPLMDIFPLLYPCFEDPGERILWAERHGRKCTIAILCELILWAEKYGLRKKEEGVIPSYTWPDLHGPF